MGDDAKDAYNLITRINQEVAWSFALSAPLTYLSYRTILGWEKKKWLRLRRTMTWPKYLKYIPLTIVMLGCIDYGVLMAL